MTQHAKFISFLEQLNKLTKETGIIIDSYGDPFYNPSLATHLTYGGYNAQNRIYFTYDETNSTYIGRIGDPYDGEQVFPVIHKEEEK